MVMDLKDVQKDRCAIDFSEKKRIYCFDNFIWSTESLTIKYGRINFCL
jgi:hypothetical protein